MTDPFIGELRIFAGNFPPQGWLFCDGLTLAISEYDVLFALIGTTYGGDGQNTFRLPDLRGRVPISQGTGSGGIGTYQLAQTGGAESVALTSQQLGGHNHNVTTITAPGTSATGSASSFLSDMGPAGATNTNVYAPFDAPSSVALNPATIGQAGGNLPHNNIQPSLAVNYIIAFQGIFPQRS
jgi:microcystin-dependent protein